jgi:GTP-binding protein
MRILQERRVSVSRAEVAAARDPAIQLLARAQFRTSVAELHQLPPPDGREVAFAGRSNAGKSSALSALARRRNLAFVSKTPGRTQLINYFGLDETCALVDLPGYGYAAAPGPVRNNWQALVGGYLAERENLAGLVLLMDARHPFTPLDQQLMAWFAPRDLPVHILLTKADKLTPRQAKETLIGARKTLDSLLPQATLQLFSSLAKTGIVEAAQRVAAWLRPLEFQQPQEPQRDAVHKKPPVKGE